MSLDKFNRYLEDYKRTVKYHSEATGREQDDAWEDIKELRETLRAVGERCGFSSEKTQRLIANANPYKTEK